MEQTLGADNEAECRALFTGFAGLLADVIEDSIADGRLIYHADRMADCLAVIETASCAEFQSSDESFVNSGCQDPFEGQVADGGECANDFDCVSEYCSGDQMDFEGNITFGACADAPAISEPCDDNECTDDAFCDTAQQVPTCEALLSDGSGCTSDNQCASGTCDAVCGASTTCDGVD